MSDYRGSLRQIVSETSETFPSEIDPPVSLGELLEIPTTEDMETLMYAQDSTDLSIFRELKYSLDFLHKSSREDWSA